MELDETDRAILEALREDARRSYREVAEIVGVSPPTVGRKVKDLEGLGLLVGYRAVVDPVRAGESIALLDVRARPAVLGEVADAVADVPAVREVLRLAGSRLHVRVHHRDPEELDAVLDALEGFEAVEEVRHQRVRELVASVAPGGTVGADADVACHLCAGPIHGTPVRARVEDRLHVFCCRTCRDGFLEKADRGGADAG